MARETASKTLLVAGLLAVVCSGVVSITAVALRPAQARNRDIDRKKNILQAAGLFDPDTPVETQFATFETRVVELASGAFTDAVNAATFDQRRAAKSADLGIAIPPGEDLAGIKRRSRYALVYLANDASGALHQLILPVHGKGLWSTLYGYIALGADLSTINGFAFYEHGETPGLGGEVDNPRWKALWPGKQAFGPDGVRRIEVLKGKVDPRAPGSQYQVDGLAGATITTRGVDSLLEYWLGENGFGPLLDRLRSEPENQLEKGGPGDG